MSNYMISPFESSSVKALVVAGKQLEINNNKLHYQAVVSSDTNKQDSFIMNTESIIERYYDLISPLIEEMVFDEVQTERYRCQPRRLSMDLYGTTDLWALLLRINNKMSMLDFTDSTVKVFSYDILSFIREVTIMDEHVIRDNRLDVYKK